MSPRALAVALAILTAVFSGLFASPVAAETPETDDPAEAAAGWLARQLVDGERFEADFGTGPVPDAGLTADAVLAFDAADVAQDYAARATTWLGRADILGGYVGDGTVESYAGSLAKLALVATAQGLDPSAFGADGVDLLGRLRDLQAPSGRFSDRSAYGDFSNTIGQSMAIITLVRHEQDVTGAAAFLAGEQCADGGFDLSFDDAECVGEADATGFAVQALLAAGLDADAGEALDWLEREQRDGGGFGGVGPTEPTNTNSTALAAQALLVAGRSTAGDAAVGYLLGQQLGCDAPDGQRGAVAYDANGFDPQNVVRATAQSVAALAGTGLLEVDNDGDAAPAPVLACAAPTTAPTTPTTPATPSTSPAPQPGTTPELPATGAPAGPSLVAGSLLVLLGAVLVLVARRRTRTTGR